MPSTISGSKVVTDEIEDSSGNNPYNWTIGAEVATTSGNSVAVENIPTGVKNVVFFLQDVSTTGSNELALQLSTGGTFATSGYKACSWNGANADARSTGLMLTYGVASGETRDGAIRLSLADATNNTWVSGGILNEGTTSSLMNGSSGTISLSGALDAIRIINIGGSETFDAGTINVMFQ
tara:strand:+ start:757 stop:1296 length:540 start_codon:yes stop_codon:yes gene_type:complete